jgi:hypothetical protein
MLKLEIPLAALTMLGIRLERVSGVLDASAALDVSAACSLDDDETDAVGRTEVAGIDESPLSCSKALRGLGKISG